LSGNSAWGFSYIMANSSNQTFESAHLNGVELMKGIKRGKDMKKKMEIFCPMGILTIKRGRMGGEKKQTNEARLLNGG